MQCFHKCQQSLISGHKNSMDCVTQCTLYGQFETRYLTVHVHKPVLLKDSTATNAKKD